MYDSLCVCVLDGLTNGEEEPEAIGDVQPRVVAVFRDGDALDVLHHEEGPPALGGPAVENLGDTRMVHQGQRLPLRIEARKDGL